MTGPGAPYTRLDFNQVLQQAFDESTDRLRVDAVVTASIGEVKITDGTNDATLSLVGPKVGLDVNVLNSLSLSITDVDDSIKIGNGSGQYLVINADGSIKNRIYDSSGNSLTSTAGALNVNIGGGIVTVTPGAGTFNSVESGTVDTAYNEVTSVASAILTTITTYNVTQPTRLKWVDISGSNIAEYTVNINGTPIYKKRTYYGNLDNTFSFSKGYNLVASDVITVKVIHYQPSVGDFSAFILVLKD